VRLLPWRRRQQSKPIDEAEAYDRSYGTPAADIRIVKLPPRRPRDRDVLQTGENLRRAFLERLERRRGN
jgi:hypothetical protein